ncbi:D-ribose-binding periplasmic protein precursor [Planctomycetes bacterium Pan216]|uniref:D-ribose-binding periplasmic protein n=1 Tax=Kolteria novifilia TaxID=2527975 RepID=A0A518B4J8_9BACT|nr:D-ribose-binding periplasmic protein precursor [Planctomycetes bacterium Pan216]
MRLTRWTTTTVLLAFLALGCGQSGGTGERGTIGVSVLTLTNPFFKVIADTIKADAAERGYDVIVTSGEYDVAKQQAQVKDFIVKGVSAIVLCPCDSKSIGPAIQEANQKGIPVFTADIACLAPEAEVVSHIATDNFGGGKQAAQAMIEALGEEGGQVVVLDFKQAESCILRVDGFKEAIAEYNKGRTEGTIDIVAELPGDGKKAQGYKTTEDALQAHPGVKGIFAINDPSALGARAALEKAGKADEVTIVGFDGQPMGKQAIKEGKIYADPIQFPDKIGAMTMDSIVRYFNGEEVPPEQLIETALYRKEDARQDNSLDSSRRVEP